MKKKKIGVIGAGSFGTALAMTLTGKGHQVKIWGRKTAQLELMRETRENPHYLPGVRLPDELEIACSLESVLQDADVALFSVPAQTFRDVFAQAVPFLKPETVVVNVAKGIEKGTLLRLSQVAREILPTVRYVALSGPSHAEEVARNLPTTVAVAAEDEDLAREVQEIFITDRFRVYRNNDMAGVELGGALKNIIALGAGASDGLGYGDNAKAALMTRGITEMCRLGTCLGADMETFSGLTGIGDLIVTCTSMHSRNRRCGILIGKGVQPEEAIREIGMVVEGISTAEAAWALAQQHDIEMPITESICRVLQGEMKARDAVDYLMNREMKNEMHIL
ncbi:MAG: NAD(P)H-dependent glycerol-3-phosphate dehydrogenase [Firmicutes bacterium]|nr:NAD(P)H-dependent glycerol-3-phosphate dehydrogenase [Bacillota bacterium]MDD7601854.1 NAD(P)H-dependent glycerol-3-phosphate dehydrogenase [Bacillota bacterium]MDY5855870.1 NAD(P)H-dependent glycerol-3-phosphate dehydrogenase [Anaerovoracaceae bacterium]